MRILTSARERETSSGSNLFLRESVLNIRSLLAIPKRRHALASHLLLQLQHSVEKRLSSGRAAGHVDVDGHDSVAAAHDGVWVVVVAAAVGATSHGENPLRIGHLVVDEPEGGCHFVCEGSGDDHEVGLTRRGTEDNAEPIHVVSVVVVVEQNTLKC